MDDFYDGELLDDYEDTISFNSLEFESLLNTAILTLKKAKSIHDVLETYYIQYMKFEEQEGLLQSMLKEVHGDGSRAPKWEII